MRYDLRVNSLQTLQLLPFMVGREHIVTQGAGALYIFCGYQMTSRSLRKSNEIN